MVVTLDRTRPLPPLTLEWVKGALLISAGLFGVLLALALLFLIVAVVWYALCLIWIALVYTVLYVLASIPILILLAALGGAAEGSKGAEGGGCAVGGVLLIGGCIVFNVQGGAWDIAGGVTSEVYKGTLNWADGGWQWLTNAANGLWRTFMDYDVYAWAWVVFGAGVTASAVALGLVGAARSVSPARRVLARVRFQCPRCASQEVLYRCPGCRELHAELVPSRNGIWTAQCEKCGTTLGTTDTSGRQQLGKVCAGCSADLDHPAIGRFPEYHIAVVGAKNSGKTTLMVAALMAIEEEFAPAKGWRLTFANAGEESDYRARVARMKSGQTQPQTARAPRPTAFTVAIEGLTGGSGVLLYLYDAAGEDIQDGGAGGEGVAMHDFHAIVDGVILVVDPFAETGVRHAVATAGLTLPAAVNAAPQDALYILGRMIPFWVRARRGSSKGQFDFPLAVVVTKLDAGGLAGRVGGYAEHLESRQTMTEAAQDALAQSDDIRRVLQEDSVSDLLELIESHFRVVEYFGTSALGRVASSTDRSPFRPRGAAAPLVWLLSRVGALTDHGPTTRAARAALSWFRDALRGQNGGLSRALAGAIIAVPVLLLVYPLWAWWGALWTILFVGTVVLSALVYRSYRSAS